MKILADVLFFPPKWHGLWQLYLLPETEVMHGNLRMWASLVFFLADLLSKMRGQWMRRIPSIQVTAWPHTSALSRLYKD